MVDMDSIKLGAIVGLIAFIYMIFASINNYLPPAIAIGIMVAYIYNRKIHKNIIEIPRSEIEEVRTDTILRTCPLR